MSKSKMLPLIFCYFDPKIKKRITLQLTEGTCDRGKGFYMDSGNKINFRIKKGKMIIII